MAVSRVVDFLSDHCFGGFSEVYRATHYAAPPRKPCGRCAGGDDSRHAICDAHRQWRANRSRIMYRNGVRNDLLFLQSDGGGRTKSRPYFVGTNACRGGDAAIHIDDDSAHNPADRDHAGFLINREIKHVLSNDAVTGGAAVAVNDLARPVIAGVGCVRALRAFSRKGVGAATLPLFGTVAAFYVCNRAVDAVFRWREVKADTFAIANATDEELKGGWRWFVALRDANADISKNVRGLLTDPFRPLGIWRESIRLSSSGEDTFDHGHPTFASRIRKIEQVASARGVTIDETKEASQVERLRLRELRRRSLALHNALPRCGEGKKSSGSYEHIMCNMLDAMLPEPPPEPVTLPARIALEEVAGGERK
ncbi:MAG: hypothetical protein OXF02_08060 [Simkaniaceae bacterium]|nr:hypothetical protein [Simkaniaceae bacterium]